MYDTAWLTICSSSVSESQFQVQSLMSCTRCQLPNCHKPCKKFRLITLHCVKLLIIIHILLKQSESMTHEFWIYNRKKKILTATHLSNFQPKMTTFIIWIHESYVIFIVKKIHWNESLKTTCLHNHFTFFKLYVNNFSSIPE